MIKDNRDTIREMIKLQDLEIRKRALFLWLISSDESDARNVEIAIEASLSDPDAKVRTIAAQFAGIFKQYKFAEEIEKLHNTKSDIWERHAYCLALVDFGRMKECRF